MNYKDNFAIKIILAIIFVGLAIFIAQIGRYYKMIKTGEIDVQKTSENFSAITNETIKSNINYKEVIDINSPSFGAISPELTIVEFGNFACPYSKQASHSTRQLMLEYQTQVKFIYREFPIDELYENSSSLSLIGKCAEKQNKFWITHDKLYQATDISNPIQLALQSGLDKNMLEACVKNETNISSIQKDLLEGLKNGVQGTPTFFFIKKGYEAAPLKIEGAAPKEFLKELIDKMLKD